MSDVVKLEDDGHLTSVVSLVNVIRFDVNRSAHATLIHSFGDGCLIIYASYTRLSSRSRRSQRAKKVH